jgi:hypothetical protein
MLGNIQVSNLTPTPTINLVVVGMAIKLIIFTPSNGLVFITITVTGQGWAVWISAGFWKLGWHIKPPSANTQYKRIAASGGFEMAINVMDTHSSKFCGYLLYFL